MTFALRFRADGRRHYLTLSATTRVKAEEELEKTLAAVKLGVWQPPRGEARRGQAGGGAGLPHVLERVGRPAGRDGRPRTAEFWRWRSAATCFHTSPRCGCRRSRQRKWTCTPLPPPGRSAPAA